MKNRRLLVKFSALFIILVVLTLGYIYYYVKGWDNKIYPNSYVNNIDVSGLSLDEGQNLILKKYNDLSSEKITAVYENQEYPLSLKDIKMEIDPKRTLEKALKFGKDKGFFNKDRAMIKRKSNIIYLHDERAVGTFKHNLDSLKNENYR